MTDNAHAALLEKFAGTRPQAGKVVNIDDDDVHLCWGCVRGNRRAFNIEFRKLNGAWRALEYAWLQFADWCPVESAFMPGRLAPAGSIILNYSDGHRVLVAGRNMRDVYQKLLEHQIKYLSEVDRASDHLEDDEASVVTRIEVIEPSAREAGNN